MALSIAGAVVALVLTQASTTTSRPASGSTAKPATGATSKPAAGSTTAPAATSSTGAKAPAKAIPLPPPPQAVKPTTPPPAAPAPAPAAPPAPPPERPYPTVGVALDAALPAGAALNVIYRPVPFVRLWAGPAWNYVSWGGQIGFGLAPWQMAVTPVLSIEAGRYRSADVKAKFGISSSSSSGDDATKLLENVSVRYGSVLLGFEFGSARGFSFDLRLGLTRLWIETGRTATFESNQNGQITSLTLVTPSAQGVAPALKLGFLYWF